MKVHGNMMVCHGCWGKLHPDRGPYTVVDAPIEKCGLCRELTASGIYLRAWVEKDDL